MRRTSDTQHDTETATPIHRTPYTHHQTRSLGRALTDNASRVINTTLVTTTVCGPIVDPVAAGHAGARTAVE